MPLHRRARLSLSFVALAGAFASSSASAQVYQLVWSDEFDGTSLNLDNWSYQTGTGTQFGLVGWGNNELQYYTSRQSNISVSDGTLKITAIRENFSNSPYTSARIRSFGKQEFLYGRIEARIKLPSTSGVWPAFWMLPTSSPYGGWAASGEIDIVESVNNADRIYGTTHFGGEWPNNRSAGTSIVTGTDYSEDFHEYAIEWEQDQIRWYLDGELFYVQSAGTWFSENANGSQFAPFDTPFHLLLNVAVGGNFPGNPNGSAQYPQTMEVDYVRVFSEGQAPYLGSPVSLPGVVETEDFDVGGNGESYSDVDAGNNGFAYRQTDVDIQANTTDAGFSVAWILPGEWLEYTVETPEAGTYGVTVRASSFFGGDPVGFSIDGQDVSGDIVIPATGGVQNWTDVTATLELPAGRHILRFESRGTSTSTAYSVDRFMIDAPIASIGTYEQDFEGMTESDADALANDGWLVGANVFDPTGTTYLYGYFADPAPNGGAAFSELNGDLGGPAQGDVQMSVFNDYSNGDQALGNRIEAVVFQERTVGPSDVGTTMSFSFDAHRRDLAGASAARAFLKILDPDNGFSQMAIAEVDMTGVPDAWTPYSISLPIEAVHEGKLFQFGFDSTASNYQPSGIDYDNLVLAVAATCSAADLAEPFGSLDVFDVLAYLASFDAQDPAADLASPSGFDVFDVLAYLAVFDAGCP